MRIPRQSRLLSLRMLAFAGLAAGATPARIVAQGANGAQRAPGAPGVQGAQGVPLPSVTPKFPAPKAATLSPRADSVANYLTFAPVGAEWFTAAVRNKQLLLDIGRVDAEVRRDSLRAQAFREAVEKRSTVPLGATFRLRGPWGAEDATTEAVVAWNGRIALRLRGSEALDSLVRATPSLVVSAQRVDRAADAVVDSCDRKTPLAPEMVARLAVVRDSVEKALRAGAPPIYDRLRRAMFVKSSQLRGCFGGAKRVALLVSLRAGSNEWSRERIALVDTLGKAWSVRINDYRFRVHDLLSAFDADGDGVDDFAVRAATQGAGGTTILVLDFKARRASRLSSGFVWEEQ